MVCSGGICQLQPSSMLETPSSVTLTEKIVGTVPVINVKENILYQGVMEVYPENGYIKSNVYDKNGNVISTSQYPENSLQAMDLINYARERQQLLVEQETIAPSDATSNDSIYTTQPSTLERLQEIFMNFMTDPLGTILRSTQAKELMDAWWLPTPIQSITDAVQPDVPATVEQTQSSTQTTPAATTPAAPQAAALVPPKSFLEQIFGIKSGVDKSGAPIVTTGLNIQQSGGGALNYALTPGLTAADIGAMITPMGEGYGEAWAGVGGGSSGGEALYQLPDELMPYTNNVRYASHGADAWGALKQYKRDVRDGKVLRPSAKQMQHIETQTFESIYGVGSMNDVEWQRRIYAIAKIYGDLTEIYRPAVLELVYGFTRPSATPYCGTIVSWLTDNNVGRIVLRKDDVGDFTFIPIYYPQGNPEDKYTPPPPDTLIDDRIWWTRVIDYPNYSAYTGMINQLGTLTWNYITPTRLSELRKQYGTDVLYQVAQPQGTLPPLEDMLIYW